MTARHDPEKTRTREAIETFLQWQHPVSPARRQGDAGLRATPEAVVLAVADALRFLAALFPAALYGDDPAPGPESAGPGPEKAAGGETMDEIIRFLLKFASDRSPAAHGVLGVPT